MVQALSSELAAERFYRHVISGFSRPIEVQFDLVEVGPLILALRGELTIIVDLDRLRSARAPEQSIQDGDNIAAPEALTTYRSKPSRVKTSTNHAQDRSPSKVSLQDRAGQEGIFQYSHGWRHISDWPSELSGIRKSWDCVREPSPSGLSLRFVVFLLSSCRVGIGH